jgi:hypothetical protein
LRPAGRSRSSTAARRGSTALPRCASTLRRVRRSARSLRCCALDRLLVEESPTAGADLALDVVRDTGALPDSVNSDRAVLMAFEGHSLFLRVIRRPVVPSCCRQHVTKPSPPFCFCCSLRRVAEGRSRQARPLQRIPSEPVRPEPSIASARQGSRMQPSSGLARACRDSLVVAPSPPSPG